jgi:hypothetical protein
MPPPERSAGACARAARFRHHQYRSLHVPQAVREAPPTGSRRSRGRYGGPQESQTVTRAVPPICTDLCRQAGEPVSVLICEFCARLADLLRDAGPGLPWRYRRPCQAGPARRCWVPRLRRCRPARPCSPWPRAAARSLQQASAAHSAQARDREPTQDPVLMLTSASPDRRHHLYRGHLPGCLGPAAHRRSRA